MFTNFYLAEVANIKYCFCSYNWSICTKYAKQRVWKIVRTLPYFLRILKTNIESSHFFHFLLELCSLFSEESIQKNQCVPHRFQEQHMTRACPGIVLSNYFVFRLLTNTSHHFNQKWTLLTMICNSNCCLCFQISAKNRTQAEFRDWDREKKCIAIMGGK